MLHMLEHTLQDVWMMIPLLYISYIVIEYFERRENNDDFLFRKLQKYGPFVGAIVGIFPQCGFSILAAMLYLNHNITLGTLLSVFIATSDEAIPVLIANPELYTSIGKIVMIKILVAMLVGYVVDKIVYPKQKLVMFSDEVVEDEDQEGGSACPCCYVEYPMWISALLRTLKIFGFIFITTFILNLLIHEISEEALSKLLLTNSIWQPILASFFGLIPNCVASVVLTQLYVANQVSFASLMAGLITNAGLGIVVLVRYGNNKQETLKVIGWLVMTAWVVGVILSI